MSDSEHAGGRDKPVKPVQPVRPVKTRGFPVRLLLYAIVMTGAAGGAGYLAWNLRADHSKASTALSACQKELEPVRQQAETSGTQLTTCQDELAKTSALQQENDAQLTKMQSNLSATKDELEALRAQKVEAERRMAAINDIQAQFAKMIDTGQLTVSARHGSLVVELPAEVLFPSASAELSEKGELAVLEVGLILKRFPDRRFLVVGHTDNVPLKSKTMVDNWELSTARALTVTRFLVKAGMNPESLVPAGVGEHDPLVANSSGANRQRNRRIEIVLLPAITELPPLPSTLGGEAAPATPSSPAGSAAPGPPATPATP